MKRIVGSSVAAVLATIALQPAPTLAEPPKDAIGAWGIDTAGMSKTVRPGNDFYRYVNEGWLKTAKIPQGLPATDALTELYLSTEQRVLEIIKEAQEGNDAPGTPGQLIADYHRSFADRDSRSARRASSNSSASTNPCRAPGSMAGRTWARTSATWGACPSPMPPIAGMSMKSRAASRR